MEHRPNIIFIMVDQLGAAELHCYGGEVCSTPTIDHLASRGVRFDRCYASSPLCAPSRATFLTGRSPEIHGITDNNLVLRAVEWANGAPTYAHVLQKAGYKTGGFGKFHVSPMQSPEPPDLRSVGFDEVVITEDPKLGSWLDWIEREYPEHYRTALAMCWPMPYITQYGKEGRNLWNEWRQAHEEIILPLQSSSPWSVMYPSPLPKELHQTTFITNEALRFMQTHVQEQPDSPFFCKISYVDPHDPYDPPAPYDSLFHPDDMPDPIPAAVRHYESSILEDSKRFNGFDALIGNLQSLKQLRALYHGSLRFIDDQIARIVRWLDETGLCEDTILVFTSDHGEMLGDHELITKGAKHYDKGIRCPLIVCGTGIMPKVTDRLTCTLDFFPTLCDWGMADSRPPLEGRSFAAACKSDDNETFHTEWDDVLIQGLDHRGLITSDRWRLTMYFDGEGHQMHDLHNDPTEQQNLYAVADWSWKRQELMERMIYAMMRSGRTQQYENLPIQEGMKCLVDEFTFIPLLEPRNVDTNDNRRGGHACETA